METKQVIVIRKDLKMRRGKEIAQGAHASIAFLTNKLRYEMPDQGYVGMTAEASLTPAEFAWINNSFTKVCVRVDSEEALDAVCEQAKEAGLTVHLIVDRGLTEFGGVPTKTACAIGPDFIDRIDPVTKHLTLY